MKKTTADSWLLILISFGCLVMFYVALLPGGSSVGAEEKSGDTLYAVYGATKIGMTVDEVRNIVKRLSPQDIKEIPESLEQSGNSTHGSFEVRILHKATKDNDFTYTYLTLIFLSDGYDIPLTLASARWEKRMQGGSSLEYSKKKGR